MLELQPKTEQHTPLSLMPISLRIANDFVEQLHRHHHPTAGHKFSIGAEKDGKLVGVIICGRPVSRFLDDGYTLENNRVCTDGTKNACSTVPPSELPRHWAITRSLLTPCRVNPAPA